MKFGTDGIRGKAGEGAITAEGAVRIGRAAARLGERVLIAQDTRPSGPMLAAGVAAGVAAEGGQAVHVGVLPTSGLAFALAGELGDAGVMITASHNPAPDNGFKVFGSGGHKLTDAQQESVETWLTEAVLPQTPGGVRVDDGSALLAYCRVLSEAVPFSSLSGRRIALDLANGAAVALAPWLRTLDVDWVLVGDGDGVVNEGVGSEHLATLQEAVLVGGCVGGIAVDGDGDRCRIVDGHGRVLPGDAVTAWLAKGLCANGVAVTVMSNGALEPALPACHVVRTDVGDRHLRAAMARHGLTLGGEESGHILFADLVAGDGLIAGLRALALGDPADAFDAFAPLPRKKGKVRIGRRPPIHQVPELVALQRHATERLGNGGRLFLRYSGTEPVLRILVEGEAEDVVAEVMAEATRQVQAVLG